MNLVRCQACGTLNVISRDICKDCEAPLDLSFEHMSEEVNASGPTEFGFKVRMIAAGWFGFAAFIPILFVVGFAVFASGFLLTFLTPVLLAGMFGFNFGAKILDPVLTKTGRSAAIKGAKVSLLAFVTYLSIVAFGFYYNATHPSATLLANIFIYGTLFVGWLVLVVGTLAGYSLYKTSLGAEFQKWITNAPKIEKWKARLMTVASVMVLVMLSIAPLAYTLRNQAIERNRQNEMWKIRDMAEQGRTEELRAVLSKDGVDPDFKHIPGSPIFVAAAQPGQEEMVKMLLEHGADPNRTVPYSFSALTFAARRNDVSMMQVLVEGGADVNLASGDDGITSLMYAGTNIEAIDFLLDRGAFVNLRDRKGRTAIGHLLEHRKRNEGRNPDGTFQVPEVIRKCDDTIALLRKHGATE